MNFMELAEHLADTDPVKFKSLIKGSIPHDTTNIEDDIERLQLLRDIYRTRYGAPVRNRKRKD